MLKFYQQPATHPPTHFCPKCKCRVSAAASTGSCVGALELPPCSALLAKIIGNPQAAYERHMPRNFQERNPALNTSAEDWKPFLERFLLLDA